MSNDTREIVLSMLVEIERGQQFSSSLIKAVLDKYDYLDARDKSFIKRMTEGTIERRIELDYYLNSYSKTPVNKMKPMIRCILRMGVYQILYMDGVPDAAACNEACKLATAHKFVNLKGFVNGVLRNIARNKDKLPLPDRTKDLRTYLSVAYSMPLWIIDMWMADYGPQVCETILKGLMEVHPVSIRFRTDITVSERERLVEALKSSGVKLTPSKYLDYVYRATELENLENLPGFAEGKWTVQDVSSALAVEAAGVQPGDTVVDVCAAPGGKTLLAAEKATLVICGDVSEEKVDIILENADRMLGAGSERIQAAVRDASVFHKELENRADILICDVPCSGLGVIGKKRDIKYNASPEGIRDIVALEKEIIRSSWRYVKPGGIMIYSTCTIDRAENEEMVQWICDEFDMAEENLGDVLAGRLATPQAKNQIEGLGQDLLDSCKGACLQILPGVHEADGFFIARLRRKGGETNE